MGVHLYVRVAAWLSWRCPSDLGRTVLADVLYQMKKYHPSLPQYLMQVVVVEGKRMESHQGVVTYSKTDQKALLRLEQAESKTCSKTPAGRHPVKCWDSLITSAAGDNRLSRMRRLKCEGGGFGSVRRGSI